MNINEIQRAILTGGIVDMSNEKAPKTVVSDELIGFRLLILDEKSNEQKSFRVMKSKGETLYRFSGTAKGGEKINDIDCRIASEELTKLNRIIRETDLISLNGRHLKATNADTESFSFDIEYASGERVSASFRQINPEGWRNNRERLLAFFTELTDNYGYSLEPSPLKTAITRGGTVVASYSPKSNSGKMRVFLTVEDRYTALEFFVCDVPEVKKGGFTSFEISPNEIKSGMSARSRATGERVQDVALVERAVADGEYNIRLVFDKGEAEIYRI